MIRCLRALTDGELISLMEIVFHEALVEEVRHRLKKNYEVMAYEYYNGIYKEIGNLLEPVLKPDLTLLLSINNR